MNSIIFIIFILFFFLSQYMVVKSNKIKKILKMNISKMVILGIAAILASVLIGLLLHVEKIIVPIVTVFVSSIITTKLRESFEKLEGGKKV